MEPDSTGAPTRAITEEFDWTSDDSVVSRRSDGLAVYSNRHGMIVIRKEADYGDDTDPFFVIAPGSVPRIISALRKAVKEAKG